MTCDGSPDPRLTRAIAAGDLAIISQRRGWALSRSRRYRPRRHSVSDHGLRLSLAAVSGPANHEAIVLSLRMTDTATTNIAGVACTFAMGARTDTLQFVYFERLLRTSVT